MSWTPKLGEKVTSPCVEFDGYCDPISGYGIIKREGRNWKAHRWAYTQAHGPIPDGMWVLHRCDNRPCVNPDHLFLGDAKANAEDMVSKGRHASQLKTVCPEGHPLSGENLFVTPAGYRRCHVCLLGHYRNYNAKRSAS